MSRCDREDECVRPRSPLRWCEGEPLDKRAHAFAGRDYFILYYPECCPGVALGDSCYHRSYHDCRVEGK